MEIIQKSFRVIAQDSNQSVSTKNIVPQKRAFV